MEERRGCRGPAIFGAYRRYTPPRLRQLSGSDRARILWRLDTPGDNDALREIPKYSKSVIRVQRLKVGWDTLASSASTAF